jgi:chemotaxis protein histidine kinase CheA
VGDPELLNMLAAEAERRGQAIISGLEELAAGGKKDSARVEELRVDAHGLKGAALVVGESRLADLARLIEAFLSEHVESGRVKPGIVAPVIAGVSALTEGAHAAAEGVSEPSSVGESLQALGG